MYTILNVILYLSPPLLFADPMTGLSDFEHALQLNPNHIGARLNRAELRATVPADMGGSLFAAIDDYSRVLVHSPTCIAALVNRGICRAREANLSAAISDYDLAIKAEPSCGVAYFNRGVAYEKIGNHAQVLEAALLITLDWCYPPCVYTMHVYM